MIVVLLIATVCVVTAVFIHFFAVRTLAAMMMRLERLNRFWLAVAILGAIVAHLVEIEVFAAGVMLIDQSPEYGHLEGEVEGVINHFYYSAVTFTSLGYGDITPVGAMRILAAVEALTGLVLITWTASFTFLMMQTFWSKEYH